MRVERVNGKSSYDIFNLPVQFYCHRTVKNKTKKETGGLMDSRPASNHDLSDKSESVEL
jgi:hypothetical protein